MKTNKIIALLLSLILCFGLCACGGGSSTNYSIGDAVETESTKLVLNDAQFAIALSNVLDSTYLEPKEYEPGEDNPYLASDGTVYVYYNIDLSAIGRSTLDIQQRNIVEVKYDGKKYSPKGDNVGNSTGAVNFLLLSGDSENIKGYFEIPVDAPLDSDFEITFHLPAAGNKTESFTYNVSGK